MCACYRCERRSNDFERDSWGEGVISMRDDSCIMMCLRSLTCIHFVFDDNIFKSYISSCVRMVLLRLLTIIML
jgi:hypothetical protein